jgi:hypothetical protein
MSRSWRHYNKSLINRGNFFLLVSEEVIEKWQEPRTSPGRKCYSDLLIQTLLTLRHTLRMTFRSIQGMAQGLVKWAHHHTGT